jgi:hypothetical protein
MVVYVQTMPEKEKKKIANENKDGKNKTNQPKKKTDLAC